MLRGQHAATACIQRAPCRFKWPDHPQLKFSPAVGHLLPGAAKRVTVAFAAAAPLRLEGQELKLQVVQVQQKGAPTDWDDAIAAAAAAATPGPAAAQAPAASAQGGKAAAAAKGTAAPKGAAATAAAAAIGGEPLHDVVPKTQRDIALKVGVLMFANIGCCSGCLLASGGADESKPIIVFGQLSSSLANDAVRCTLPATMRAMSVTHRRCWPSAPR